MARIEKRELGNRALITNPSIFGSPKSYTRSVDHCPEGGFPTSTIASIFSDELSGAQARLLALFQIGALFQK
jgi:hypothetical protein